MWHLVYHPCDFDTHMNADWCKPWLAPPPMSSSIKSFMRNHDCASSFYEWHTSHLDEPTWTYTDWVGYETTLSMNWNQLATTASTIGCCDACAIAGGNVDVYYWPVSGSNTDCTASIGTSLIDPDAGLFTTDARGHKIFESQPNPYATVSASNALISSTVHNVQRLRYRSAGQFHNISISANQSIPTSTNHSIAITKSASGSLAVVSGHTLFVPLNLLLTLC